MKRIYFLIISFWFGIITAKATTDIVYMNVGDTRTLSFNAPPYIVGTQWTISDWNALTFTTTPGQTSTMATVKALSPRSAADRCIVHCVYYYRELDPTTGRYTYQRTGYHDWEVIIRGEGGGGGGNDGTTVSMHLTSLSIEQGKSILIQGHVSNNDYSGQYKWSTDNNNIVALTDQRGPLIYINGISPGKANVRVTLDNGNYDEIPVSVWSKTEQLDFTLTEDGKGYAVGYKENSGLLTGTLTIPSSYNNLPVTEIKENGFWGCEYLNSVIIPNSVTVIGNCAFNRCSGLNNITIPNSVKVIGAQAFQYCTSLNKITIPNSVTTIGGLTFSGCTNLTNITLSTSLEAIEGGTFDQCNSLTSLSIPNSVKKIGMNGISDCANLTTIHLPNSIVDIWLCAFYGLPKLEHVYYNTLNPVQNDNKYIFDDISVYSNATLHIPNGALDIFKNTSPWKEFNNIVDDMPAIKRPQPESIELSSTNLELNVGDEVEISAKVWPVNAEQDIKWSSSDDNIAYVDVDSKTAKAKIIAMGNGSCEIYAYPANYPNACKSTCKVTVKEAQTEDYLYVVGTINNWNYDDDSRRLYLNDNDRYATSLFFEKTSESNEFVFIYRKGDKVYKLAAHSKTPLITSETFTGFENGEIEIHNHYMSIAVNGKENLLLPDYWPGGTIDIEVSKYFLEREGWYKFSFKKSNLASIDAVVNDDMNIQTAEYYTLQGIRCGKDPSNLPAGIYIKRLGTQTTKVIIN